MRSRFDGRPAARKISERLLISGPIVKGGRIEVGSVRPHQCFDLRIDRHLVEQFEIAQGAIQFAGENRSEIDRLFGIVVETNTECVRSNELKGPDPVDRTHLHTL
jgi:hypothetical protein